MLTIVKVLKIHLVSFYVKIMETGFELCTKLVVFKSIVSLFLEIIRCSEKWFEDVQNAIQYCKCIDILFKKNEFMQARQRKEESEIYFE